MSKFAGPLSEQLKALENLQEIDLKIDQLTKQKNTFPSALKGLDDGMAKLKAQLQVKTTAIEEIEKVQRQTRAAQELNRDRLTRSTARLESVQNSNEFQAVQKELDQLKKLTGTLEEQIKKSEVDIETGKKDLETLTSQFEQSQTQYREQASTLGGQSGALDGQINGLMGERAQFTAKVDPRTLSQYDRVRHARGGMGISLAIAGRCQACNMIVPPQLYIELQRGSNLHDCPSCKRILFARPQQAKAD